jgi:putative two-component system response regulator
MEKQEKILIVDDETGIRRLLNHKLSKAGYTCQEAESAERALEKMKASPAELMILDIKMPGKSGIELLPEIKAKYPNTSVIMATAITDASNAINCMREGADDYICKPFNLEEVAISADKALEKRRLELEIREYQERLQQKVEEQTAEIRRLFLGAIEALVFALEAKDKYTAGHSRRVTKIALAIARELGLPRDEIEDLRWGSLLHDVGKIAVNQSIQNKPEKLTPVEYEHIMIHTQIGAGIVKPVVNDRVVDMIEHHHDRYDGTGLNQTVAGEDIPLGARIMAVADAFDAMTSHRPYRPAMPVEEALGEIKRCVDTQFDPVVARAFLKISASLPVMKNGQVAASRQLKAKKSKVGQK